MKYLLIITFLFFQVSCVSDSISNNSNTSVALNKVLLLKVNYENNAFEGGHETVFTNSTSTFTVTNQVIPPSDFGNIKLFYSELNSQLFDGDIIWMGNGQIHFPTSFLSSEKHSGLDYPSSFTNINLSLHYSEHGFYFDYCNPHFFIAVVSSSRSSLP